MKWLKQIALVALLLITTSSVQAQEVITPLDSNYAKISKGELKYITQVFIEYAFLRDTKVPGLEQSNEIQGRIISDRDSVIVYKDKSISLLARENKELQPGWWDGIKFWAGLVIGTIAATLLSL